MKETRKEDKEDLDDRLRAVWKNFDNYCTFGNFDFFKKEMKPLFDDWYNRVDSFDKDNKKWVLIIQRFDEILWEKASKIHLEEVQNRFANYLTMKEFNEFLKTKTILEKERTDKLADLNSRVDEIIAYTKQLLATSIVKITQDAKNQVLDSLGGKPVEPKELHALLKLKANVDEFELVNKSKASKGDIEVTTSIIEILHSQINHICLILKDYFKLKTENSCKDELPIRKKIE